MKNSLLCDCEKFLVYGTLVIILVFTIHIVIVMRKISTVTY
jgi:hypothetical protein